jgi:hypothetical protein
VPHKAVFFKIKFSLYVLLPRSKEDTSPWFYAVLLNMCLNVTRLFVIMAVSLRPKIHVVASMHNGSVQTPRLYSISLSY